MLLHATLAVNAKCEMRNAKCEMRNAKCEIYEDKHNKLNTKIELGNKGYSKIGYSNQR